MSLEIAGQGHVALAPGSSFLRACRIGTGTAARRQRFTWLSIRRSRNGETPLRIRWS